LYDERHGSANGTPSQNTWHETWRSDRGFAYTPHSLSSGLSMSSDTNGGVLSPWIFLLHGPDAEARAARQWFRRWRCWHPITCVCQAGERVVVVQEQLQEQMQCACLASSHRVHERGAMGLDVQRGHDTYMCILSGELTSQLQGDNVHECECVSLWMTVSVRECVCVRVSVCTRVWM